MSKLIIIAFGLAGICALPSIEQALAKNPNGPQPCYAVYRDCIEKTPQELPNCAAAEIACRDLNKKNGNKDPSDPFPDRTAGGLKPVSGVSLASPQRDHGMSAGIAASSALLKRNPGSVMATMDGAVSRAKSGTVTNSGKISTNATTVTNSGVIRRGSVAGHPVSGPAGITFRPQ